MKSAYHLGIRLRGEIHHRDTSSSMPVPIVSQRWNRFWSLNLPPKVRMFLWRLAKTSLPLRMNIKRKHVDLDTKCPVCMRLDEDGGHLFLKCKKVKQVWRELQLDDVRFALLDCTNPMAMFDEIWLLTPDRRDLVFCLLWDWWNTRNRVNQGDNLKAYEAVAYSIRRLFDEWRRTMATEVTYANATPKPIWCKPGEGVVKINLDAAFYLEEGRGAWGCVARASQGEFVAACAGKLEHVATPLQAEATACVKAIEAASEMGIHHVIFESDSLQLVNAINSDQHDLSTIGVLLQEARSLCYASFDAFQFTFCKRSCNKVAHYLADFGFRAGVMCTWWKDQAPECVRALVASESAVQV